MTPNQITAVCNLLAYAVAALLATGHLLAGAIGAIVVGVVDGLDGRQARVQLRTTPLGRLEHLLDKVYEILWMVAPPTGCPAALAIDRISHALLAWIAAYLLDTVAYDVVKWDTGATLDEASPLDASSGSLPAAATSTPACCWSACWPDSPTGRSAAIVWWAVVTAAVHGLRAGCVIWKRRSRVLV